LNNGYGIFHGYIDLLNYIQSVTNAYSGTIELIHSELVEGERGAATICFLFLCAILFFPLVILQLGRGFELFCTLLGLVLCKIGIVAIIRYFHYEVTSMGMGSYFLQIGHGLLLDFLF
jgi:hypothetical protein